MFNGLQRQLEARICHNLPHLREEDVRALAQIVDRLIAAYEPERIYLFGSKARGDYGPDSDFDLMVVVPDNAPESRQQSRLAYERLWGTNMAADVLVWTRGRFESRTHLRASLPATILREGRLPFMKPDPACPAEAREWFAEAVLDLRAAEFEFTAVPPLTADIAFHAQQLAEKALKGLRTEVEPVPTCRIVYLPLVRQALSAGQMYEVTLPA